MRSINDARAHLGLPPLPFPIGARVDPLERTPPEDMLEAAQWYEQHALESAMHRAAKVMIQGFIFDAFAAVRKPGCGA